MTAAASNSLQVEPADRQRWLIVGDTELAEQFRRLFAGADEQGDVVETTDYFTALGELAGQTFTGVVGPVSLVEEMPDATVTALRELAPKAQLVLTATGRQKEAGQAAIRSGFDQLLVHPILPAQLQQLLGVAPSSDEANGDDAQLGDVDLVEAMLDGGEALPDLALRLVRAQSQIPGLALAQPQDNVPDHHACAEVHHRQNLLGVLHAPPPATREQLQAWSDWLGPWLTLHRQHEKFKELAMCDELTGAWNRRYFNRFLRRILSWAQRDRSQVTLMVFDIDDFKMYNDRHGHMAGDEILREAARLMKSVCREHDVVARIGGDEFAVIFWDAEGPRRPNSRHPLDVVRAAERFQKAICSHAFPKLLEETPETLTISAGLASYPWDGQTAEDLTARADEMALASKRSGKNALTFGPGAARICRRQ